MRCPNCGCSNPDDAVFCRSCLARVSEPPAPEDSDWQSSRLKTGGFFSDSDPEDDRQNSWYSSQDEQDRADSPFDADSRETPQDGQVSRSFGTSGAYDSQPVSDTQPARGMKWHHFLIWFALWASGIMNIISGFSYLSGSYWDMLYGSGTAASLYETYPGTHIACILFGLLSVLLGVLQIVTRFRLARFRRNGPPLLLTCYLAGMCLNLFMSIAFLVLLGSSGTDLSSMFASALVSLLMTLLNWIYYRKRADLFIH